MIRRVLLILLCMSVLSVAQAADISFPALTGRIVDNAHLLNAETSQRIDTTLAAHEQATSDQIVVVTVPNLKNIPIEEYGYQLGRHWGIGQKGKNNGALLIVAPKEHRVRIEVGYGLEGTLTDAASAIIINRIITPAFKRGDYNGGIEQGVNAMLQQIGNGNINDVPPQEASMDGKHLLILLAVFFLFLYWMVRGRGVAGPFLGGWIIGGSINNDDDDDSGPSFTGGGGSFGGGGSSGSW